MRSRLLVLLVSLMAVVLLSLGVPLAVSQAKATMQSIFFDRLNDTSRFSSMAQGAGSGDDVPALGAELRRYAQVYGVEAAVVGLDGNVRVASSERLRLPAPGTDAARRVTAALGGRRSEPPEAAWPWSSEPLVVAEPVVSGGDVVGAVVTSSPTQAARRQVLRSWGLLALAELAALVVGVALAGGLTRWVLRPVRRLDSVVHDIATGRLAARVPPGAGPVELRRLVGSFNDMADHVETLVEQQRAFVADASHELRNLLGALLLRMDDLALRMPAEWETEVALASDEGRRLARVLDRLLELARAEHDVGPTQLVDLVALVDGRLTAWRSAAAARRIDLRLHGDAACAVHVDAMAVSVALDAVLDNAIRFGPVGSQVRVDVLCTADETTVSVQDQGEGLEPEELSRAGDRFWRSARHQNVEGSGLGLAIARTLLGHCGGRLAVQAGAPRGLVVTLALPGQPTVSATSPTSTSPTSTSPAQPLPARPGAAAQPAPDRPEDLTVR